jgi:hypothetical protein
MCFPHFQSPLIPNHIRWHTFEFDDLNRWLMRQKLYEGLNPINAIQLTSLEWWNQILYHH